MQPKTLRALLRWMLKTLSHVHASGLENVPQNGGCILAVNHLSRIDPPLVYALLDREDATSLVAEKYFKNPFFRYIVQLVNGIWINRGEADMRALRQARQFLMNGGVLGIAPEGTRSRTGGLIPAKTGVAYLADKANVPVLPVALYGTESAVKQLLRLKRPHLYIHFGDLFRLPPIRREQREADLKRNTDEIMCRIAALLPEQYRGVYRHQPCLETRQAEGAITEPVSISVPDE